MIVIMCCPNEVIAAQMLAQGHSPSKELGKRENCATGQKDENGLGNF